MTKQQIDWREKLDELCTGKLGDKTWAFDNREIKELFSSTITSILEEVKEEVEGMKIPQDIHKNGGLLTHREKEKNKTLDSVSHLLSEKIKQLK